MDLELLGTNPDKILTQLRRAVRARYRYIHLSNAQGVKADPAVDNQLLNHVQLLTSLAVLGGVDAERIQEATNDGARDARAEA